MNRASVIITGPAKEKHSRGIQLYAEGRYEEAASVLKEALSENPAAELANDWAAAELALGHTNDAVLGFCRALEIDDRNIQAAANLGSLLATLGRAEEAIPLLERAAAEVDGTERETIQQLLQACRMKAAREAMGQVRETLIDLATELRQQKPVPPHAPPRPPVYVGNNRALICTTFYRMMYVDTTDLLIAPRLLMQGEWEPEETELFKRLIKPGQVFVDVGANIGYYSLLAATLGASQVYAFEPQKSSFELLGKNVIINWMNKLIRFENLAVYSHTTDLTFFARTAYPGNSSIGETAAHQLGEWFDASEQTQVRAVSLDDYFSDKPGRIDLLKIDVEGAEPAAFEGARILLQRNPDIRVLCEWSPDQMATAKQQPQHLIELWKEQRFRAFALHTGLTEVNLDTLPGSGYQNLLLYR